jgi:hypothetical protein
LQTNCGESRWKCGQENYKPADILPEMPELISEHHTTKKIIPPFKRYSPAGREFIIDRVGEEYNEYYDTRLDQYDIQFNKIDLEEKENKDRNRMDRLILLLMRLRTQLTDALTVIMSTTKQSSLGQISIHHPGWHTPFQTEFGKLANVTIKDIVGFALHLLY